MYQQLEYGQYSWCSEFNKIIDKCSISYQSAYLLSMPLRNKFTVPLSHHNFIVFEGDNLLVQARYTEHYNGYGNLIKDLYPSSDVFYPLESVGLSFLRSMYFNNITFENSPTFDIALIEFWDIPLGTKLQALKKKRVRVLNSERITLDASS